jgi:cytochrome c oxidase subunit 4
MDLTNAADYAKAKGIASKGFVLLGVITIIEVFIALVGNGHLIEGMTWSKWIMYPLMIGFSLYKAYYIVSEFMHLGHEVKAMAWSVVLPMSLLVWAVIAFMNEGGAWRHNREYVNERNAIKSTYVPKEEPKATTAAPATDTVKAATATPKPTTEAKPAVKTTTAVPAKGAGH